MSACCVGGGECHHASLCILERAEACENYLTRKEDKELPNCNRCVRKPCAFKCFRVASDKRMGVK